MQEPHVKRAKQGSSEEEYSDFFLDDVSEVDISSESDDTEDLAILPPIAKYW